MKLFLSLVISLILNPLFATLKDDYSTYLQKYEMDKKQVVVFVINGNDCVNCYAAIKHTLATIKIHESAILFLIKDVPQRELEYFLYDRFGLVFGDYKVVIDPPFFEALNLEPKLTSSITILNQGILSFQTDFKNLNITEINQMLDHTVTIQVIDSIDISSFGGGSNSELQPKNDSSVIIFNSYRGILYDYNYVAKKIEFSLGGLELMPLLDELLRKSELTKQDFDYAFNDPQSAATYATVPHRVAPRGIYTTQNFIYVPVEVLAIDLTVDTTMVVKDSIVQVKWLSYFLKYNKNWKLIEQYPFTYGIAGYPNHFNYLQSCQFFNDSTFAMSSSTLTTDSIVIMYTLPSNSNQPKLINFPHVSYPDHFPLTRNGIRRVYIPILTTDGHYFYRSEPVLYSTQTNTSIQLDSLAYTPLSESTKSDIYIDFIHPINNKNFLIGNSNYAKTWCSIYDHNYNFIQKMQLLDRPFGSSFINQNKLIGISSTDDFIKMFIYEIK